MESDLAAKMPVATVAVQNVYYDVPTARLVRESPYWREQVFAHLRQHRELLVFMGGDFDVNKIPAIVLDETRNGLTVTPSDFGAYIELLKDEESAQTSAAPASDANTNKILSWWSLPGPPPPIAHTGSVLARMAHYFGRERLSRDIQKALLQMKQTQYTAKSDVGPDEIKEEKEKELAIWLYDGGGRRVVSGDDSPEPEEITANTENKSDSTSGEDVSVGSTFVLPPMLSPLLPLSPLSIMEPRIVLSLPPMHLPMCLPSPAVYANTHATVARQDRQARQARHASAPGRGRLPRPCYSASRSGRDTLVVRSPTGDRPRPPVSVHVAAHRRWQPYRYPDPLAGLGYYIRDRHSRPSGLPSRDSRTARAHTSLSSRGPSAVDKRQGPPTGQSEGQDDSESEAGYFRVADTSSMDYVRQHGPICFD